jgi:hypothetical protein
LRSAVKFDFGALEERPFGAEQAKRAFVDANGTLTCR